MPTYFVHTTLPLNDMDRAIFAGHHHEKTQNELSVLRNVAGTECLVKVNCDHTVEDMLPVGFTPIAVIEGVEAARALLATPEWSAPPV